PIVTSFFSPFFFPTSLPQPAKTPKTISVMMINSTFLISFSPLHVNLIDIESFQYYLETCAPYLKHPKTGPSFYPHFFIIMKRLPISFEHSVLIVKTQHDP